MSRLARALTGREIAGSGRRRAVDAGTGSARRCVLHMILDMGFGGSEKLVQELAIHARSRGMDSAVICLDAITRNTEPLEGNGVPVELVARSQAVFDPIACVLAMARARAHAPDLIHVHDMGSLAYAVACGLFLDVPVVMTEHSRHYIEERGLRRLEKRLLCLGVRTLVTVSPELAQASRERDGIPQAKITVIENGVDLERFDTGGESGRDKGRDFRQGLGVKPEETLVGMVGRLEEIKGPGFLLDAFARLVPDHPEARLVFVGDGGLDAAMRAKARELGLNGRVHFAGARGDIPAVMAGLDILVLPSLSEGLPFALLEGMAAGRAVVASSVGRIPGIVDGGGARSAGLLVPPGRPEELADRLAQVLGDPELRRSLGDEARSRVSRLYDKRGMLSAYEDLYRRTFKPRKRP